MNSSDQNMGFEELIEYLTNRSLSDLEIMKQQKLKFINKVKYNRMLSSLFDKLRISFKFTARLVPLILVISLIAAGPTCLIISYVINNNNPQNIALVKLFGWIGTIFSPSLIASGYLLDWAFTIRPLGNFTRKIVDFFESFRCFFEQKSMQFQDEISKCDNRIEGVNGILSKLPKAWDCYFCMINRNLQDKTFNSEEIELLYKNLSLYDINFLIYLLYHDRIEAFDSLSFKAKKVIEETNNIEELIKQVREFNDKRRQEYERQVATQNIKIRRAERFRFYQYDEIIEEVDNENDGVIKKVKTI